MMGNTEGTAEPADSVETAREVSIAPMPTGKEQLQQEYDAAGGIKKLAEKYGIKYGKMRNILMDAGVEIRKRGWNASIVTPARIEGIRKRWEDASEHDRHRETVRKQWSDDPDRRQRQSARLKDKWANDADYREAASDVLRHNNDDPVIAAKMHRQWDDPSRREQQRQSWLENVVARNPIPRGEFPSAEVIMHGALKRASVSFTTNAIMLDAYIVDILIHQRRLVIEVDGLSHAQRIDLDDMRDADLRASGYEVARISNQRAEENADEWLRQFDLASEDDPVFIINVHYKSLGELRSIYNAQKRRRKDG